MRKLCLLSLLLWVFTAVRCQIPSNEVAPEDAAFNAVYASRSVPKVTGKLLNLQAGEAKNLLITYSIVTPFAQMSNKKTIFAQPDGSFTLELDYAFPYQQIWFGVGNYFYAGLCANSDLYVELDLQKIRPIKDGVSYNGDGVRYLGTDGPLNVYLNNYILYKRPQQLDLSGKINMLMVSRAAPDSLVLLYNGLYDSLGSIQAQYIAANPSPYSWMLENERLSEFYGLICTRYWGKTMDDALWQKIKQHKSFLVSNSGTTFYSYLAAYVQIMPGEKGSNASLDRTVQRLDSLFPPAKADYVKLRMNTSTDVSEQKWGWEKIAASMKTPWCLSVEKKEWASTSAKLDEINQTLARSSGGSALASFGKPMIVTTFGASLYKAEPTKALDFVQKLKQSFPGKAIVIDRWATWCAPCLGEMPHSKELQEASKDLPVVFVYLCTTSNSSESKWKSKVVELKQPGIHFLIDEKLDADLSSYFSFNGYPGYALINKAGLYKPGAIQWMGQIQNKDALAALIEK
jgi:thiol-disulfide isomerase/thioredoxin